MGISVKSPEASVWVPVSLEFEIEGFKMYVLRYASTKKKKVIVIVMEAESYDTRDWNWEVGMIKSWLSVTGHKIQVAMFGKDKQLLYASWLNLFMQIPVMCYGSTWLSQGPWTLA